MIENYSKYIENFGLSEQSSKYLGYHPKTIEKNYSMGEYQDEKVETIEKEYKAIKSKSKFDQLRRYREKLEFYLFPPRMLADENLILPLGMLIFLVVLFNIIITEGTNAITFWTVIGTLLLSGIVAGLIEISLTSTANRRKNYLKQKVLKLEELFKTDEDDVYKRVLEAKLNVIRANQVNEFEKWKKRNINRYPYHLNFFHEESFEYNFLVYTESIIKDRVASGYIEPRYAKFAQYLTIIETDKIMIDLEANDYNVIYVKRSTNKDIPVGMYLYSSTPDSFRLFPPPYNLYKVDDYLMLENEIERIQASYLIFDEEAYQKTINESITINHKSIIKFDLFGTELMKSTVSNHPEKNIDLDHRSDEEKYKDLVNIEPPGLVGTMLSQLMFGSTFTILKAASKMMSAVTNRLDIVSDQIDGVNQRLDDISDNILKVVNAINNISIQTTHEIVDTRSVQIIFNDNSDIELEGVSIYYDLNRYLAQQSNSQIESKEPGTVETKTNVLTEEDASEKIKKYKKMFDDGLIDEDEFKEMKKEVLKKII